MSFFTFDTGVGTVDPPDLLHSPARGGSSTGETSGSERLVKSGRISTEISSPKVLEGGKSDQNGSIDVTKADQNQDPKARG